MVRAKSWKLRAGILAGVASAAVAAGGSLAAPADAQIRITVPGASSRYFPGFVTGLPLGRVYLADTGYETGEPLSILEGYDLLNHVLGENWFPGTTPQVVNYPASMGILSGSLAAPGVDLAVEMGRAALDDQIGKAAAGGNGVVIAALSEGTLVVNRELAYLASHPDNAPSPDQLSFAMFGSPELGLFTTYLPPGLTLPIVDYTAHALSESQYDVSIVFRQYDGWGDPPDRPWNLLADVNSIAAASLVHNSSALTAPADVVQISQTTNHLGGTTTVSMIPSPTLPLLLPLQQLGVPTGVVEALNSALKPIVDAGYSRLSPDAGPHFFQGQLVSAPPRASAREISASPAPRPVARTRSVVAGSDAAAHRPAALRTRTNR